MKKFVTPLMFAAAAAIAGVAVTAQQPARPAAQTRPVAATAGQRLTTFGTIKEIMQTIVDPSADVLFDSVSYNITTAGIEEVQPRTTEDWMNVRRNALLLAEATNLLQVPGRRVAPEQPIPGLENEPPGPEDLTPAEIQPLIDGDRAAFNKLAQGLADAAVVALKAADARSVEALFESGDEIDKACENCHLKYWYPPNRTPAPGTTTQRKR